MITETHTIHADTRTNHSLNERTLLEQVIEEPVDNSGTRWILLTDLLEEGGGSVMTPTEHRAERAHEQWIDDRPFTIHCEPDEQGGEEFAKCRGCAREILPVDRFKYLSHPEDCPVAAASGARTDEWGRCSNEH